MSDNLCLVGDIGGTNARFAVADLGEVRSQLARPHSFECADFSSAEAAIDRYFETSRLNRPESAVIAMAGPVERGAAESTNGVWRLSESNLRMHGFKSARLINDYTALALAAPRLQPEELASIGPEIHPDPEQTIAVVGAGTGFGVSALARSFGAQAMVVTEGGHIGFAPSDEVEIEIVRQLSARFGRVSVERILSGPGIADLHWALARIRGGAGEARDTRQVVELAKSGRDELCIETLERFCAIYGSVAGDFALAFGARGGVFIGGGIAPRIVGFIQASGFRRRFEEKGRFRGYMAKIPCQVILHPYAALVGAAAATHLEL